MQILQLCPLARPAYAVIKQDKDAREHDLLALALLTGGKLAPVFLFEGDIVIDPSVAVHYR